MSNFFDKPILNSPYERPLQHRELDFTGQPTGDVEPSRRSAKFITPIPKPKRRRGRATQVDMVFEGEAEGLSTSSQAYDPTPIINLVRSEVDEWWDSPERPLLYVACTRARDWLVVTGVVPGSEFLADLDVH